MSSDKTKVRSTEIIVALIAAVAVIVAAIIGTMKSCESPTPPVALEIRQPVSGSSLSATSKPNDAAAYFPVAGTLSGSSFKPNLGVYAVVYDGGAWWIQNYVPAKEGPWNFEAWVGGVDNEPQLGKTFKVRAVLADIDTVENHKKNGLPVSEDAKEINPVTLSNAPEVTLSTIAKK